jgi:hypothetical protein
MPAITESTNREVLIFLSLIIDRVFALAVVS